MKESTILPQKCKIPQIFVPSQTEVYPRVGLCSLGWNFAPLGLYYSPRYARGSKVDPREQSPTLGSKVLPSGKLLPEMEKKSSGFFISEEGKVHSILILKFFGMLKKCISATPVSSRDSTNKDEQRV